MSTSLLYHGFGRRGYQHVYNRYYEGAIHFHIRQDRFSRHGPACPAYKVQRKGVVLRRFRTAPIGLKPVWIVLQVQRLLRLLCGVLRQVKYDYPISTGPLEGANHKIKAMQRQAYGFRDLEFFKLKILAIHETRHALVG